MPIANLDDKITPNFTYRELIRSETGDKLGLDNTPSQDHLLNIIYLAENLQKLRDLIKKPIKILSGYRCQELNKLIGGSEKSQHMVGQAADIICPGITPLELALFIFEKMPYYDQLILEFNIWVHVSFKENPRKQALSIRDRHEGYTPGIRY